MSAPRDFASPRVLDPHYVTPLRRRQAARLAVLAIAAPTPYERCLH